MGKIQPWNHSIELPFGVRTASDEQVSHGKNLIKWSRMTEHVHTVGLKGKRILDVGCNEGFFSLRMIEQGAAEVVGIDADNRRIQKAQFVADVWAIDNVSFEERNIFDESFKELGHFDFVLCMGFLHRIPEVYNSIRILTEMSDSILFEWKALTYDAAPVMEFRGAKSKDGNDYSKFYWAPSISFVAEILKSFGFVHNLIINDKTRWRRAMLFSSRLAHPLCKDGSDPSRRSKCFLLYKYSMVYLKNVYKVLAGRITR